MLTNKEVLYIKVYMLEQEPLRIGGGDFGQRLSEGVNRWVATEKPRIDAFDKQLSKSARLLVQNKITERDFFDRIMGDGTPLSTDVRVEYENGATEVYHLERFQDKKLRITVNWIDSVISISKVTAQIGVNRRGKLIVDQVTMYTWDEETGKLEEVEGDFIPGDFYAIGLSGIKSNSISKQKLGEGMLHNIIHNLAPLKRIPKAN